MIGALPKPVRWANRHEAACCVCTAHCWRSIERILPVASLPTAAVKVDDDGSGSGLCTRLLDVHVELMFVQGLVVAVRNIRDDAHAVVFQYRWRPNLVALAVEQVAELPLEVGCSILVGSNKRR